MAPYKFVKHAVPALEELKSSYAHQLYEKRHNLTREEKDSLVKKLQLNSYSKTCIPYQGWMFPFHDILKTFIAKVRYYGWQEIHAPDKTSVRKFFGSYNIFHIVEIPNKACR